jgi:hypothetical protein
MARAFHQALSAAEPVPKAPEVSTSKPRLLMPYTWGTSREQMLRNYTVQEPKA